MATSIVVHIDVKDVALLHMAAVLDPDCNGARLQAWGEHCNMNDILAALRRLYPDRKFMDDFTNQTRLSITADADQPLALLKKWGGQDGWTSLEQSVADEMEGAFEFFPEYSGGISGIDYDPSEDSTGGKIRSFMAAAGQ